MPDPVCVLGMHRSGSSLVTELLCANGFSAGDNLIGSTAANPHGHFEDRVLVQTSKKLLIHFGGSWDRPPELPENWMESDFVRRELARVQRYAEKMIAPSSAFVVKDPRFCLLLPFYEEAIGPLRTVVTLRNRADVSRSIVRRNLNWRSPRRLPWRLARAGYHTMLGAYEPVYPMDHARADALWDAYYDALLRTLPRPPAAVVHYERLLADPEGEANRLLSSLSATEQLADAGVVTPAFSHGKRLEPDEFSLQIERRLLAMAA